MKSRELTPLEAQRELELFRQPEPNDVPAELLRKQQCPGAAFTLAVTSCGLPDQQIADFVGIDAGTFSKMKRGLATLQADQLAKFCYAVNNRIWPEWMAYQLGCTLVEIKTAAERRAEAAEARAAQLQVKVDVLMEAMRGKAVS